MPGLPVSNPGEDLAAEADEALAYFESVKATHEELIANLKDSIVQYRHLRANSIPLLKAKTERLRLIELEGIAAVAEANRDGAEKAVQLHIEAVRLARERYNMVRSKMADRREEKGLVIRDGGHRGA